MQPITFEQFAEFDNYAKAVNARFLADLGAEKGYFTYSTKMRRLSDEYLGRVKVKPAETREGAVPPPSHVRANPYGVRGLRLRYGRRWYWQSMTPSGNMFVAFGEAATVTQDEAMCRARLCNNMMEDGCGIELIREAVNRMAKMS